MGVIDVALCDFVKQVQCEEVYVTSVHELPYVVRIRTHENKHIERSIERWKGDPRVKAARSVAYDQEDLISRITTFGCPRWLARRVAG